MNLLNSASPLPELARFALTLGASRPSAEAPMPLSIDSLLNRPLPIRANPGALGQAARSGVIEAVVLSSSPLLKPGGSSTVTVQSGQQQLALQTPAPLPPGTRVTLQVSSQQIATLLAIVEPGSDRTTQAPLSAPPRTTNAATASGTPPLTVQPLASGPANPEQIVSQALREALPIQQPLRQLLPLLQPLLQHHRAQLPPALQQNLQQLLDSVPNARQLQQPAALAQALRDSGSLLEARLARVLHNTTATPATDSPTRQQLANDLRQIARGDIKAQVNRLVQQLEQITAPHQRPTSPTPGTTSPATAAPPTGSGDVPLTYPPAPTLNSTINPAPDITVQQHKSASGSSRDAPVDVLLKQLSRQLLASLARTQIQQLETVTANRNPGTPDQPAPPVNSWQFELPIQHGQHTDNLKLRLQAEEQGGEPGSGRASKLWTVMLNFDLHRLGKLHVQLKVIDQSVSARVWSEREPTHQQVKQQIQGLKQGLEQVGVKVRQVDCQLGRPPPQQPIHQQLVDVRT